MGAAAAAGQQLTADNAAGDTRVVLGLVLCNQFTVHVPCLWCSESTAGVQRLGTCQLRRRLFNDVNASLRGVVPGERGGCGGGRGGDGAPGAESAIHKFPSHQRWSSPILSHSPPPPHLYLASPP